MKGILVFLGFILCCMVLMGVYRGVEVLTLSYRYQVMGSWCMINDLCRIFLMIMVVVDLLGGVVVFLLYYSVLWGKFFWGGC